MNKIEEFDYINNLYSIYKNLLTDKQQKVIENYYVYNLSLGEIATTINISRSAVNDTLTHAKENLLDYEDKLGLYKKEYQVKEILEKNKVNKKIIDEVMEVI